MSVETETAGIPDLVSPLMTAYVSLRWHYPNQVHGSKGTPSSQPVYKLPVFNCIRWHYTTFQKRNQEVFPASFSPRYRLKQAKISCRLGRAKKASSRPHRASRPLRSIICSSSSTTCCRVHLPSMRCFWAYTKQYPSAVSCSESVSCSTYRRSMVSRLMDTPSRPKVFSCIRSPWPNSSDLRGQRCILGVGAGSSWALVEGNACAASLASAVISLGIYRSI